jgi:uncharacterized tellurite resistance protein B-like protein
MGQDVLADLTQRERRLLAALLASMASVDGRADAAEVRVIDEVAAALGFDLWAEITMARTDLGDREKLLEESKILRPERREAVQTLLAKMARADGVVSDDESAFAAVVAVVRRRDRRRIGRAPRGLLEARRRDRTSDRAGRLERWIRAAGPRRRCR